MWMTEFSVTFVVSSCVTLGFCNSVFWPIRSPKCFSFLERFSFKLLSFLLITLF
jgi:hypothetical protein